MNLAPASPLNSIDPSDCSTNVLTSCKPNESAVYTDICDVIPMPLSETVIISS